MQINILKQIMQMEEFWWQGIHISLIFAVLIPSGNSEKLHLLKKTKGEKKATVEHFYHVVSYA